MRKPVHHRDTGAAERAVLAAADRERDPSVAPTNPSFARDIVPIFAPFAAAMMWRFDLTNYDAVLSNAQTISTRLSQAGNLMPPPPFPPLTQVQIDTFNNWIQSGCNP